MFTRRHYVAVADAMAQATPNPSVYPDWHSWVAARDEFTDMVRSVSGMFNFDNPRFDTGRFWNRATREMPYVEPDEFGRPVRYDTTHSAVDDLEPRPHHPPHVEVDANGDAVPDPFDPVEAGRYDDDPSPYAGTYSEE